MYHEKNNNSTLFGWKEKHKKINISAYAMVALGAASGLLSDIEEVPVPSYL